MPAKEATGARETTLAVRAAMIAAGRFSLPRRRRVMRSRPVIVSILLHLLVLALVMLSVRPRRHEAEYVPPAPVAMVFENGGGPRAVSPTARRLGPPERVAEASRPAALNPVSPPAVARAAPPSPLHAPATSHPLAAAPPSSAQIALASPPPTVLKPAVPAARAVAPSPPVPLRGISPSPPMALLAPVTPKPRAAAPPEQQYSVRLPPPSETEAFLEPPAFPAPRPFVPAPLPMPPSPPRHVPPPPPAPPAPHYLVMNNMSYGGPLRGTTNSPRQSGQLNLALNRSTIRNALSRDFAIQGNIGPDWRAELTQWVNERKYYPEQALELGQQGSVMIRLVIARNGSVLSDTLVESSGSPFLDSAWLGLFQGARLPPFPPGTPSHQITLEATMHFILISD